MYMIIFMNGDKIINLYGTPEWNKLLFVVV